MTNRLLGLLALSLSLSCAWGCSSDPEPAPSSPPFENPEDVQAWATLASAVAVYSHVYEAIGVADGELSYTDPECPTTSDEGSTFTISGNCTESSGREWTGQAILARDGDDRTLTLTDFNGNDGTANIHQVRADLHEFELRLVTGDSTTIDYAGSVQGGYTGPTLWNGSGRVERDGFFSPRGTVDAATLDELVDDTICSGQPASGMTTLDAGADTAVITYDGASDCDAEQQARLSVNNEDRGLISGISCGVGPVGASGKPGVGVLATLFAFALWRARRWS